MIHNYLEISERAKTGEPMSKEDWDFRIIEKVQEMVEKYDLSWSKENITPDDPDLADRVFKGWKRAPS